MFVCRFTNAVLLVIAENTVIMGTLCGTQYYFVAVGVGAMFVWPRRFASMRVVQAAIGLGLFLLVMRIAGANPLAGPPLPPAVVESMLRSHVVGAYVAALGLAWYSVAVTERTEAT